MTTQGVADEVRSWFGDGHLPSLELPDGWFGRPYDSGHSLSQLLIVGDRLLLVLDDRQLLVVTRPDVANRDKNELVLSFEQLVFDWQGYGDRTPHAQTYSAGHVRFASVIPR